MQSATKSRYLVACPVLLSCLLLVHSRKVAGFQVPCGTPAQDAQILSYAPELTAGRRLFSHSVFQVDRRSLLKLAEQWDDDIRAGKLRPLTPVSLEDSPQEGERGAIMRMESQVVAHLLMDANRLAANGNLEEATSEVLIAARLSESLKYSDFSTVYQAGQEERSEIDFLNTHCRTLSPDLRAAIRTECVAIFANRVRLKEITRLARDQFYDWKERMADPCTPGGIRVGLLLCQQIRDGQDSRGSIRNILNLSDEGETAYIYEYRLAWRSEQRTEAAVSAALTRA